MRLLAERGYCVRAMARHPGDLETKSPDGVEIRRGDVLDRKSVHAALSGVSVAFYLVHAMGASGDFEETDRISAANFAAAALDAGVRRIIYLSGLGEGDRLSPHLRSRQEVGAILRGSGVPTIELRASVILGSGSLSYELIRSLVEKLPVMITPRWVHVRTQPIAVEDVLEYLVESIDIPVDGSRILEIGGADRVSYKDLMGEYARQRGLRRLMIPVPWLTPRLSSLWLRLVTPVYAHVGRQLIDGLRNATVVRTPPTDGLFEVRPRGVREALRRAIEKEDEHIARTRWSDARSAYRQSAGSGAGAGYAARLVDTRKRWVGATPCRAFAPIRRIGGDTGWYYATWTWKVRGFVDVLLGGAGLRRGRRDPDRLAVGEPVDFWRVEAVEPDRLLRLRAEMRVPGRAWLQFEVTPVADGAVITQTAIFDPMGLFGLAYWYALYPLHSLVFSGMLRGIADSAARSGNRGPSLRQDSPVVRDVGA
jgi:uncharacterized protein YbjT (DUF2867 family)